MMFYMQNHFVLVVKAKADKCHNLHVKMDAMKNLIVNESWAWELRQLA